MLLQITTSQRIVKIQNWLWLAYKKNPSQVILPLVLIFCLLAYFHTSSSSMSQPAPRVDLTHGQSHASKVPVYGSDGTYSGRPWINTNTMEKHVVAETEFARCEFHTVEQDDGTVVDDWLFLEEKHAVNVIVRNGQGQFVVFEQEKYAIPGKTLSPVGGFIEDGETPYQAAKREVEEELGLGSRMTFLDRQRGEVTTSPIEVDPKPFDPDALSVWEGEAGRIHDKDPDWIYLGYYRTAANRGGGFLYSYLLKNAAPIVPDGGTIAFRSTGDNELQTLRYLSKDEVLDALSKSQFQEVKWTATIALAMLHLDDGMSGLT